MRNPYSERWELDIQQQITPNLLLEVGYIGNRTNNVTIQPNGVEHLPRPYLSTSNYRDAADNAVISNLSQSVPNPFYKLVPNGGSFNTSSTVSLSQLLAPYPQFPVEINGGSFGRKCHGRCGPEQYVRQFLVTTA